MEFRRPLAGSIVSKIVFIYSVDDVLVAMRARVGFKLREQLVLAVEATVLVIFDVVRIVKFICRDVFVLESGFARKRLGIALMRFRNRSGIGRDRDGGVPQRAIGSPRKIGGIGSAEYATITRRKFRSTSKRATSFASSSGATAWSAAA